jgi:hypothetical protein
LATALIVLHKQSKPAKYQLIWGADEKLLLKCRRKNFCFLPYRNNRVSVPVADSLVVRPPSGSDRATPNRYLFESDDTNWFQLRSLPESYDAECQLRIVLSPTPFRKRSDDAKSVPVAVRYHDPATWRAHDTGHFSTFLSWWDRDRATPPSTCGTTIRLHATFLSVSSCRPRRLELVIGIAVFPFFHVGRRQSFPVRSDLCQTTSSK